MPFQPKKTHTSTEEEIANDEVVVNDSPEESIFIGEKLKEQRLKLGLTIEDVCAKTKIRKAFIIAIENNNLEILPGKVYIQGFLNNYIQLLGLPRDIINHDPSCVQEIKKDNQPPFKFYVYSEQSYSITTKTIFISLLLLLCVFGISKLVREKPSSAINHNNNYSVENKGIKPSSDIAIQKNNIPEDTQKTLPVSTNETTPPHPTHNDSVELSKVEESNPPHSTIEAPAEVDTKSKYLSEDLNLDDDDDD